MKELIHRDLKSASQFFKRIDRWNGVIVFNSRNVTPEQASSLLDVPLGQLLGFAQFSQPVADDHDSLLWYRKIQFPIRLTCTTDQYFKLPTTLYTAFIAGLPAQDEFVLKLTLAVVALAICALQVSAQTTQIEEKRPAKRLVQPIVPEFATKLNLSGTVKIEVTIAPDGTVKTTRIVGGHPVLAAAAESAAQKSSFQPGPKETVEVIEFKFSGK
jgi:TonB family protein